MALSPTPPRYHAARKEVPVARKTVATKALTKRKNPYSVHPAVGMVTKWAAELSETTGRSLKEWVEVVRRDGPEGSRERRTWLRKVHRLPMQASWWIAERAGGGASIMAEDEDAYLEGALRNVEEQYSGKKAALRPVYDRLLEMALSLGRDVKVCPCRTMVPFYRRHVFAEVHATTNARVDLHLALGDVEPAGRLETFAAPAGQRAAHRISLGSPADVDGEVERWLRAAYDGGDRAMKRKAPSKVPAELAAALAASPAAQAAVDGLAPGHRAAGIRFVDEAKKVETREKRSARAVDRLASGKKAPY